MLSLNENDYVSKYELITEKLIYTIHSKYELPLYNGSNIIYDCIRIYKFYLSINCYKIIDNRIILNINTQN